MKKDNGTDKQTFEKNGYGKKRNPAERDTKSANGASARFPRGNAVKTGNSRPADARGAYRDRPQEPRRGYAGERDDGSIGNGAVIGRNAVRELLRSGRPVDKLLVQSGEREGALIPIVGEAIAKGIPVVETERRKLDQLSGFAPHQGVIAMAAEKEYCTVEDILEIAKERGEKALIVIADGICDPYNLGAVIRCAEGCGAHGLILPKRHAAGLSPLVTKASAGAIEHLAIAKVANISTAIETLKNAGVWIYAAEAGGENYYDVDMSSPAAIVLGSEGDGISELVRKRSDFTVSIPMYGKVNSFNVSTAASVLLCEAARQQRAKKG